MTRPTRACTIALVLLIGSVSVNVAMAVRYRRPRFLFAMLEGPTVEERIPELVLARTLPPPPPPELGFEKSMAQGMHVAQWRELARDRLHECLGSDLDVATPTARVVARETVGELARETLVLTQRDGLEVPAYLFVPPGDGPRPALIVLPAYSWGIVGAGGVIDDFQEGFARRLAERGYVVLTVEHRGLGYLQELGEPGHEMRLANYNAHCITFGSSLSGEIVSDSTASLRYLASRDEVDADRLGAVGFSLGGRCAVYLSALDPRVKVLVASGCVMSYEATYGFAGHGAEEAVPGLGVWLGFDDVLGLVAPRPALVHWGGDDNDRSTHCAAFNYSSMECVEKARRIFDRAGAPEALEVHVTPGFQHAFDVDAALEFLERHLPLDGARSAAETDRPDPAELRN